MKWALAHSGCRARAILGAMLVASLGLAACGTSPSSKAASNKKTLVWLLPTDPLLDPWAAKTAVPLFEKSHPNVRVEIVLSPHNNQKMLAMEAAGSPPDIFTDWNSTNFSQLAAQHALLDLTPQLKAANVNVQQVLPSVLSHYVIHGQVYAVPWLANELVIGYNASLFKKYHVSIPPSSWSNRSWNTQVLLSDAKKLTHGLSTPASTDWGAIIGPERSLPWLWGADFYNPHGGPFASSAYTNRQITALYMTRPSVVRAIQWGVNLTTKYHVSPPLADETALSTLGAPISSGRVAMEEMPANGMVRTATTAKFKFKWGMAPVPYGPAGKNTGWVNENAWMVNAKTKHPKTAAEFVAFLANLPGKLSPAALGFLGPTKSAFKTWAAAARALPGFDMPKGTLTKVVWDGLKRPTIYNPGGSFVNAAQFDTAWTQIMGPVYLGKTPVLTGLRQAQAKYAKIAKCGSCKG